jgi:hypothetical protein
MAAIASDYLLKKNILQEIAKAAATGGNPDISTPVVEQGVAQGQANTQARAFSGRMEAEKNKMAEQNRQFNEKLAMTRDYLDTWKKNNQWATAIGAGNVLTAAGSAYVQSEKQNAREEEQKKNTATLAGIAQNALNFQTTQRQDTQDKLAIAKTANSFTPIERFSGAYNLQDLVNPDYKKKLFSSELQY